MQILTDSKSFTLDVIWCKMYQLKGSLCVLWKNHYAMPRGPLHTAAARQPKKKFAKDQHGTKNELFFYRFLYSLYSADFDDPILLKDIFLVWTLHILLLNAFFYITGKHLYSFWWLYHEYLSAVSFRLKGFWIARIPRSPSCKIHFHILLVG